MPTAAQASVAENDAPTSELHGTAAALKNHDLLARIFDHLVPTRHDSIIQGQRDVLAFRSTAKELYRVGESALYRYIQLGCGNHDEGFLPDGTRAGEKWEKQQYRLVEMLRTTQSGGGGMGKHVRHVRIAAVCTVHIELIRRSCPMVESVDLSSTSAGEEVSLEHDMFEAWMLDGDLLRPFAANLTTLILSSGGRDMAPFEVEAFQGLVAPLTRLTYLELYFDDTEAIAEIIELVGPRLTTLHLLATNENPDDFEQREPAELTTTQLNIILDHCVQLQHLLLEVRIVTNSAAEVYLNGEDETKVDDEDEYEPGPALLDLTAALPMLRTIGTRYLMAVDHLKVLKQLANPFSLPLLEAVPTFHLQPCQRAKVPWMHRQLRVPMFSADHITGLLDRAVAGLRQRKNYTEDPEELRRLYTMVENYRR